MTDRETLIAELRSQLTTATEADRSATLSYLNSLMWVHRNPERSPEAEQTLRQIQDIIAGRSEGGRAEVEALTYKLEDIIERTNWGL